MLPSRAMPAVNSNSIGLTTHEPPCTTGRLGIKGWAETGDGASVDAPKRPLIDT